jgi:hypothetical protein
MSGKPVTIVSRESNVPFFTGLDVQEDVVRNILIGFWISVDEGTVLFRMVGKGLHSYAVSYVRKSESSNLGLL